VDHGEIGNDHQYHHDNLCIEDFKMPTEGATYIAELDPNKPSDSQDFVGEGDDHLRQEKTVLQSTFAGGTYEAAPDVYDMAVTVGPRFLNALPAKIDSLDGDYVSLTNPQDITAEHTLTNGIKLAQGTNIQSDNDAQVIGVGGSDEVAIGSGTPVTIQDSSGQPTVSDGVDASPILTVKNIADFLFPVGSVFLTATNINPQAQFPGTQWSKISAGRFLVGQGTGTDRFNSARGYGEGADSIGAYKWPLSEAEIAPHSHTYLAGGREVVSREVDGTEVSGTASVETSKRGGVNGVVQSHENCPPAFAVYIWRRDS
jgi:hypothetical protein